MHDLPRDSRPVVVLLATFNGARYLDSQLASLFAQTVPPHLILVRDDGSTDETPEILLRWQAEHPVALRIVRGPNLGFVGNFLALVDSVPEQSGGVVARAIFFCDQDDVWLPRKIERALAFLDPHCEDDSPALVFSRLTVTNEALVPVASSPLHTRFDFGRALAENVVTGCTMAINRALLRDLIERRPDAGRVLAHDWWCYLVASSLGTVLFDPEATILYRQHASNVEGTARGALLPTLVRRVRGFVNGRWSRRRPHAMMRHFSELHSSRLSERDRSLTDGFVFMEKGRGHALSLVLQGKIWRRSLLDRIILFVATLVRRRPRA